MALLLMERCQMPSCTHRTVSKYSREWRGFLFCSVFREKDVNKRLMKSESFQLTVILQIL